MPRGTVVIQSTSLEGNAVLTVHGGIPIAQAALTFPLCPSDPITAFTVRGIRTLPAEDDLTDHNPAFDYADQTLTNFNVTNAAGSLSVIWDWCTGDPQPRVHTTEILFGRPCNDPHSVTGGKVTLRVPRPPMIVQNGCQHGGISETFDVTSWPMEIEIVNYPAPPDMAEFLGYSRDLMPTGGAVIASIDSTYTGTYIDVPFTGVMGAIRMVNVPPAPPPGIPPGAMDTAYEVTATFQPVFWFV